LKESGHRENKLDMKNNIIAINQLKWRISYGLLVGNFASPQCKLQLGIPSLFVVLLLFFYYPYKTLVR